MSLAKILVLMKTIQKIRYTEKLCLFIIIFFFERLFSKKKISNVLKINCNFRIDVEIQKLIFVKKLV